MSRINEYKSIINGNNDIQNNYIRNNSSEHIFKRNTFLNYDKLYNQFLTSHYPPIYYKRLNKNYNYQNKYDINKLVNDENNYNYSQSQNYKNYELLNREGINSYNSKINKENYYLNNNPIKEEEIYKNQIQSPIKKILNSSSINPNENYNYNDNIDEKDNRNYQLTDNYINEYENKRNNKLQSNENELLDNKINNENIYNTINYNNNRLDLSSDNIKKFYRRDGYVSPIIAQIAKKNYLGGNPYTDKEQNLGPTMLKNNPILYPIDTYKFDFNKYLKDGYSNQYKL